MDSLRVCFNALRNALSGKPVPEPYAKFISIISSPPFIDEEDKSWWPENNTDGVLDYEYVQIDKDATDEDMYGHAEELLDALLTAIEESGKNQPYNDEQAEAYYLDRFTDSALDLIYELENYLYGSLEEEEEEEETNE
jgi:hypothetical protein